MLLLGFGCDSNVLFIQLMDEHTNSWITSSIWIMAVTDSAKYQILLDVQVTAAAANLIKNNLALFL